jgi:hypothetical protein
MAPTLVRASISLPRSLFEELWRRRNRLPTGAVPTPEELRESEREIRTNVQQTVLAMLPPPSPYMGNTEQVSVTSHWDAPAAPPEPEAIGAFGVWLGDHPLAAILGALVIVAAILGMAFRFRTSDRRSSREVIDETRSPIPTGLPTSANTGGDVASSDLQESIARLVRQNPESAAELIRNWLDKAA